jgi:hypothetical protein
MADKKKRGAAVPPPPPSAEDLAFEAEIMSRLAGRDVRRFEMPDAVEEVSAIYMVKLRGKDEITAADMADATMTDLERQSQVRAAEAERREAIRLSIVALVGRDGRHRHIDQSAPLVEIDEWSMPTRFVLQAFFGEMNGVELDKVGKAVREARRLGAGRLPANQPAAADGSPAGG